MGAEPKDMCGMFTTKWGRGPALDQNKCVPGEDDSCRLI